MWSYRVMGERLSSKERHRDLRKRIGMVFEHAAFMMYPRLIFW